uniref:KIB1-4 beta-propeller domain-containing protein n=1 Tax=Fagus sylvatica TaxID=28930 RepID=A0A2N9I036_FAGSY
MGLSDRVECSDLPMELLPTIIKSLETRIDVLQFRSVCNSWRSNCPPFIPASPLEFPHPASWSSSETTPVQLCESTLYLMQRLKPSTSDDNKGMLIKVEETNSSRRRYEPNSLNLMDFRALELTKSYMLICQLSSFSVRHFDKLFPTRGLNKVVKFPKSARINVNDSAVFIVYSNGKLGFAKCGDGNMSIVGGRCTYDDVIVYKGQLYVVDRWGIVWLIRLELELVPFSQSIDGSDLCSPKYLVESCGALYVVDKERRSRHGTTPKVYKLNEEELGRWDFVNSLGDRAFVLCNDCCFSISAEEFSGFKRNCIYFTEQHSHPAWPVFCFGTRVFNLEDGSFEDLANFQHSHPAWPVTNLF